jgi:glycosyltransferase involved in cell wall biosynthesis
MRVAYVTGSFPVTFIANEVESHRLAGWEVLPLSSAAPEPAGELSQLELRWQEKTVHRPSLLRQFQAVIRETILHPLAFLKIIRFVIVLALADPRECALAFYELGAACSFAGHCRRFGAEHLHVHFASRSLNLGLIMGLLLDKPVSVTAHAFDIFTRSRRSLRARLPRCRFVAAISHFNIRFLRDLCGQEVADRCRVVHCGVDIGRFAGVGRDPQPGRMLCIANLIEKKGVDVAVAACAKLRDMNVPFLFQVLGDGPQKPMLEEMVRSLGLERHVQLLGSRPNDRLEDLLRQADLFLLPCVKNRGGDMDGIPVAMMEAMAAGVPVVSTFLSGIPELVEDKVTGRLVQPRDVDGLAAVLSECLADRDSLLRMGQAGREKVRREFDQAVNAGELRRLIENSHRRSAP